MFHSKIITAIAAATFFFSTAIAAPAHGIPNLQLVAESRRGSAISLPDNQLAGKFTATDASVAFGVQRPARANTHSKRHHTSDPDVIQACAEIDGAQAELAALISALGTSSSSRTLDMPYILIFHTSGAATSPADIASTLDQIKTLLSQVKANVAVALDGSGDIDGSGDGSGDVDTTDLINKLVALLQVCSTCWLCARVVIDHILSL